MAESNIGCLIVLEGESYVGIFTERDYARKIVLEGRSSDTTTVNEIMISDIPILNMNDTIELCSKLMTEKTLRYLPVFENNQLVNVISQSDIIKYTIDAQKSLIEHLQNYMNLK
jgi:CBS domain-containing protein